MVNDRIYDKISHTDTWYTLRSCKSIQFKHCRDDIENFVNLLQVIWVVLTKLFICSNVLIQVISFQINTQIWLRHCDRFWHQFITNVDTLTRCAVVIDTSWQQGVDIILDNYVVLNHNNQETSVFLRDQSLGLWPNFVWCNIQCEDFLFVFCVWLQCDMMW